MPEMESPIKQPFLFQTNKVSCDCLFALWSIRERRISGLDIKFQLEALNAESGSALRMEVDILGENLEYICASSAKAGSGGRQGVSSLFPIPELERLWRQHWRLAAQETQGSYI